MGWQDRNYGPRINYGETPFPNPIMNLLFGSFPLGTWFGIRVRVHATLLWFLVFQLFRAGALGWKDVIISSVILFTMILLHEFGHCIGAKMVGGHPDQILLWPFGGLAYNSTDRTPWARFVTVVCGPLVNLILAGALGAVFFVLTQAIPPLNPLAPWADNVYMAYFMAHPNARHIFQIPGGHWLLWAYITNMMLLIFNLIPIYPLDGGSLAQVALWKPLGYRRSMNISCIIGMVAAVGFALWGMYYGTLFTVFLAAMGFMTCLQQRRILQMTADEPNDGYDLSAAWENSDRPRGGKRKIKKRWFNAARKKARAEQQEQAKIDAILAKVKEKGLHSLTWGEKRTLRKATERQRQRDLANRL